MLAAEFHQHDATSSSAELYGLTDWAFQILWRPFIECSRIDAEREIHTRTGRPVRIAADTATGIHEVLGQ